MTRLRLQPSRTVHFSIDMQRLFAERTEWHLPGLGELVPPIAAIATALPMRSFFTRFMVPHTAELARGQWQHYYRRWRHFTGATMNPDLAAVVDGLASFATADTLIDKATYSVFEAGGCEERLTRLGADTVIFTGVETDVCVLASIFSAVDRGYRVVAVADALGSSSAAGHAATLEHVLTRMPDQIEIVDSAAVVAALRSA